MSHQNTGELDVVVPERPAMGTWPSLIDYDRFSDDSSSGSVGAAALVARPPPPPSPPPPAAGNGNVGKISKLHE